MGDIQRWKDMWYGDDHGELLPREDGEYVLYADHVQTVAELEGMTAEFYEKAYAAGVQAARDAVVALPHDLTCFRKTLIGCTCTRGQALAAIDALRGES